MKVIVVSPAYPYRGGIAHFADALARQLIKEGESVRILSFRRLYPKLFFPGRTPWEPEGTSGSVPREARLDSLNPWTWLSAARRIVEEDPDLVVMQYWEPLLAPALGTVARRIRRRGVPAVCLVHNALPHEGRPGAAALGRYLLNACSHQIALSERVAHDLKEQLRVMGQIVRLFHPVSEDFGEPIAKEEARRRLGIAPDARVILFFGLVRSYKGLGVLLEAVRRLRSKFSDLVLVVAGEFYEPREAYDKWIREHVLERQVRLEDRYIPRSEIAAYFCSTDIVALPYLSGTQSGVVAMAYHFEQPFVVSDVGGVAEMVPENMEAKVPPGDPDALARHLDGFFTKADVSAIRDTMRRVKGRYSWARFTRDLKKMEPRMRGTEDRKKGPRMEGGEGEREDL